MTELLTAAQMRAIEAAAIASGDVTGLELMERAGQGVVDAIFAEWPEFAPAASGGRGPAPSSLRSSPPEYFEKSEGLARRAVVLCGPGNNGGDGFVVARLLRAAGWDVDVFFYGDVEKLPPDARVNYARWVEMGEVYPLVSGWMERVYPPDVLVDAIFGTGLSRPLSDELVDCFWELLAHQPNWKPMRLREEEAFRQMRRVSIDIPTGYCADSGKALIGNRASEKIADHTGRWPRFMAFCFKADLTVTFHRAKVGHYIGSLASRSKKTVVVPLDPLTYTDLPPSRDGRVIEINPNSRFEDYDPSTRFLSLPKRGGHKFSHGHALILSGGPGKGGAARLAARGALRIGAGVVTLGVPPDALAENAARLDAVMLSEVADVNALRAAIADPRINALCVGPGFGMGAQQKAFLAEVLRATRPGRGLVLDADALTMMAQEPVLFEALHPKCVLTPHAGEFARLFPDIAEKLDAPAIKGPAYSKVDATRDAAKRAGCVVLFKGPDTVIAAADGQCSINASVYERSAPWLATAGSGDVLAGFITGLLARGFAPMEAAEAGAWLHTECALAFGPGLIAEDLPEVLPRVLADVR